MNRNLARQLNEKKYDDFLPILNNVFKKARYFGISGYGCSLAFGWSLVLFAMLVVAETVAVWKVVRFLGGWLMSASDIEHILSMISATGVGFPIEEFVYRYVTLSHGFLLRAQDYSPWNGIPIFILSKLATVLWNFQDLIIILISMGLSSRKPSSSTISRCYFLFSLSWLILRACSVVIAASDVHLHSQRALKLLHSCPSANYNIEVCITKPEIKRLQYQLAHDFVALTGMGFFSLRRELLLEVAAAILKYELVLIQYDK
ncbi:hypothetical protein HF086_015164 [Spodoptera exigua]|uniref:Uncharacterized protein n=1 Tax=Spodoptera exigua TaxID=7107 RepID=A0A922MCQ4_SPOEX|nr:hypothetical protein HF086_015164 [Spodoptera exigua]